MIRTANRSLPSPRALLFVALLLLPLAWGAAAAGDEEEIPAPDNQWNSDLAASYQQFFSSFSAADTMPALKMMPVEAFLCALRTEEPPLVLDVRTAGETGVIGFTVPGALTVPMDQVFTTDTLDKLAGNKVVVVCQAGHRATAVALGLRHVGLKDVWILKGGTVALAAKLSPKSAY